MTYDRSDKPGTLREEIRRQFNSNGVIRFMQSMEVFRVEDDVPQDMQRLLAELDRAERQNGGRHSD
jgi:hypothetical protein